MDATPNDFGNTLAGELPSAAPPWPCPVLEDTEINKYLPFLFSQTRRWGLTTNDKNLPILACKYRIKGYDHILNFVQSVGKIAQEEDHHPEIIFDARSVFVRVNTHCAYRSNDESPNGKEKGSGITIRDIRFAILLERLVEGTQGGEATISRLNPKVLTRPTVINSSDIFLATEKK
ncbi:hypothetical protein SCHPADRAFT_939656 [Schizopora paradoxa]|uniref:4a-hydroxytetrahydrobiopterin dehydratase n=1 Tax=Schizopora paradoxa TaxID=27342 RepID=A0A0H2RQT8_9AGAM|nr:hypothetical protein SCHPADRAFT_939656 [Schizopora paradoxa]